jgi:hypothetical protein
MNVDYPVCVASDKGDLLGSIGLVNLALAPNPRTLADLKFHRQQFKVVAIRGMCKDLTVTVHVISLIALMIGLSQSEHLRIGTIEFFGTAGIDVQRVRSVLPVHEQDALTEEQMPAVRNLLSKAVENAIGHGPTDISVVCCNEQQGLMVYVGLGGNNTAKIPFLPAPKGSSCLPRQGVNLYDQAMDAVQEAANKADVGEDDSHGYSLAHNPTLRAKQLAMRQYAVTYVRIVQLALRDCGISEHRRAAAEILGYATQSETQIKGLVQASRDADDQVRNNAIRALWVLATSSRKTAARVPADQFIEMLNSGIWEDRNKAGQLLMVLTASRSPQLLARLRTQTRQSLIEMARWKDRSHAYAYRAMLGRIAGFDEAHIEQLIQSGKVDEIVTAAENRH